MQPTGVNLHCGEEKKRRNVLVQELSREERKFECPVKLYFVVSGERVPKSFDEIFLRTHGG